MQRWFICGSLISPQFICLSQNIPVNTQLKFMQLKLCANINLSDIYIRGEYAWGTVEISWRITSLTRTDRHLFVDLPTYLCRAKMWRMKQQHILPVPHRLLACQSTPYERNKKAARVKTHRRTKRAHTQAEDLYAPAHWLTKYIHQGATHLPR